eukprot:TRINITY_DN27642_c0_g1_i1.p1 TRINITY_DN27642_c0_g1~~TRINITY_DN27642_c0_g1_i1.p1  ORF type:complete len:141 (+),score=44.18 TRINITY_DN27642_c0_g1_i1:140-562(+)
MCIRDRYGELPNSWMPPRASKRGPFTKEIRAMMWGFGDQVAEPGDSLAETVAAVEDCTLMFIRSVAEAAAVSAGTKGKLTVEHVMQVLGPDHKKRARVTELLTMHKRIKEARRMFEGAEDEVPVDKSDDDEDEAENNTVL